MPACRINPDDPRDATHELMGDHGEPDTTVDDRFTVWVRSFLGLTPAEQDKAWEDLDDETRVHLAADGEMIDWARCHDARAAMRAADRSRPPGSSRPSTGRSSCGCSATTLATATSSRTTWSWAGRR